MIRYYNIFAIGLFIANFINKKNNDNEEEDNIAFYKKNNFFEIIISMFLEVVKYFIK